MKIFTDKCVFCGNKSSVGFKGQGICESDFNDIFNWAFSGAVSRKLTTIEKDIVALLRREMALNPMMSDENVIETKKS